GFQSYIIGLNHTNLFANIGGFSGAGGGFGGAPFDPKTAYNGVMANADAFNKRMRVLFLSIGTAEAQRMQDGVRGFHDALDKAGVKTAYYESPGTDHEWLTWRRSLHEFAPRLFRTQTNVANAPNKTVAGRRPRAGGFGGPMVLNPDDVQAFPEPKDDINASRAEHPHGQRGLRE